MRQRVTDHDGFAPYAASPEGLEGLGELLERDDLSHDGAKGALVDEARQLAPLVTACAYEEEFERDAELLGAPADPGAQSGDRDAQQDARAGLTGEPRIGGARDADDPAAR